MPEMQIPRFDSFLKEQELPSFEKLYARMATDVSKEDYDIAKALCAFTYSSESGKNALEALADKNVKFTSAFADNSIKHDYYGKRLPEESFIGVGGLLLPRSERKSAYEGSLFATNDPAPTFEEAALALKERVEKLTVRDLTENVEKKFIFEQSLRRGDTSKEFYDFVDQNDLPRLILADNLEQTKKQNHAGKKDSYFQVDKKQEAADKMLLYKYEAAQRDASLQPRYLRELNRYKGKNKTVQALQTYTSTRYPGETAKALQEPVTKKISAAVRSWFDKAGR